jgi:hypothetical protein
VIDDGTQRITGPGPLACRRRFLRPFPDGFYDETYLAWERDYKWQAHRRWVSDIGGRAEFRASSMGRHAEVATAALCIESGRPLLFSFEKMALKDAVIRALARRRRRPPPA